MDGTNRILFEQPNLDRLLADHAVVDLHFHTRHSDGLCSVAALAERSERLGIGVAVTDHNTIGGALELDGYRHILSIPGIEVTSREGTHVLVYFYDIDALKEFYTRSVRPYMGVDVMSSTHLEMEEIVARARRHDCVIIFPHPFCAAYTGICNNYFSPERRRRLFEMADGVEVINSENLNKWNLKCAVLGFNLDKAITGGSDGHSLSRLGQVVTYAPCKPRRRAFLDAVKRKHVKVIGTETDILRKVKSNSIKLRSNLRHYPDLVEKNLLYSYSVLNSKSKQLKDNVKRRINGSIRNGRKR